jgi:hypothetical protein
VEDVVGHTRRDPRCGEHRCDTLEAVIAATAHPAEDDAWEDRADEAVPDEGATGLGIAEQVPVPRQDLVDGRGAIPVLGQQEDVAFVSAAALREAGTAGWAR